MFTKIDINEIPEATKFGGKPGPVQKDILKFLDSDAFAAEVTVKKGRKPNSVASSYRASVKNLGCQITVIERSSRVFLIKEDSNAQ